MNEVLSAISDRRSVRHFKPQQISDEELKAVINAGIEAPSARNLQKRHITVVQDALLLDEMADKINVLINSDDKDYHVFHHAPTVIVLSAEKTAKYGREDIGIMIENMSLAACSIGLDSCILGLPNALFSSDDGKKYEKRLNIPDGYEIVLSLSLGYSSIGHNPHAKPREYNVVNFVR